MDRIPKAVQVYGNSAEDLAVLDLDTIPSLVRIHGEFQHPESLILTKQDYINPYQAPGHSSFTTFINSVLSRDRIVFIGYSMNDEELNALKASQVSGLRRQVRHIALIANAPETKIQELERS